MRGVSTAGGRTVATDVRGDSGQIGARQLVAVRELVVVVWAELPRRATVRSIPRPSQKLTTVPTAGCTNAVGIARAMR
jgi:hypothetical protein